MLLGRSCRLDVVDAAALLCAGAGAASDWLIVFGAVLG